MNAIDGMQIIILAYTLGSIPFGVVLARLFHLPDPRYIGSGNIGATNMMRTGRKDIAALTLLCDMGKGAAAVLVCCGLFELDHRGLAFALLMAAVGHMYSAWLALKGGKGVATIIGATLALSWPVGIAALLVWLLACITTRYVSVASIVALTSLPLVAWLRLDGATAFILAIACGIGIWRHHSNISRLRRKVEPRLGLGKGGAA